MTNTKTTKRALLASVLSVLMCISMLIGSTFAWFTDTASTNVNKIQSGNLKVDLVDENGASLEGETLYFKDVNGKTNILWEPGCTYELQDVYVKNLGNLALTFVVDITGIKGDAKLNEAIEWTIVLPDGGLLPAGETSGAIKISGHMKETANNDYQNLTIEGIAITVKATQVSYENDSNGPNYDSAAKDDQFMKPAAEPFVLDKENHVITINTATAFFDLAKGSEAFGLGVNDYPDTWGVKIANDLSLYGATIEPMECWWSYMDGQNHTISDVKVDTDDKFAGLFKVGSSENTLNIKDLTLDRISVKTSSTNDPFAGVVVGYSANAVLKNITVTNSSVEGIKYSGGIIGQAGSTQIIGCTVKNTTVSGARAGGIVGDAFCEGGTASVEGCTVDDVTVTGSDSAGSIAGRLRNGIVAKDCTATNVAAGLEQVGVSMS